MADLSSCYFCGAAMDVSLRESTVVPDALAPTPAQQTTVVLCGTCERKLGRVLEPVVAAAATPTAHDEATAGESGASASDAATGEDATGSTDATSQSDAGGDAGATVPPSILSDVGDDAGASSGDGAGADATDEAGDAAGDRDGTPFEVDDTASVFDDPDEPSGSVFADSTDAPATTIPDAESNDAQTDGIAFDGQPDDASSTGQSSNETVNANADAAGASNDRASTGANDDADAGSDGSDAPDVDPRTYNKVVRLLKNRDLPVPRAEIESIAGSAYDIPDHECEAIIDAAIQRGLVAEADGRLTHPDGV